jgi:hypothetical protein
MTLGKQKLRVTIIGRECRSVSSTGSLNYFNANKVPEGASERCVYRGNNTAVDHQALANDFNGNIRATFTMTAFDTGRGIELFGTRVRLKGGEFVHRSSGADIIVDNDQVETIEKTCFEDHGGHLGGDEGLVDSLYERITDWPVDDVLAELRQVMHGHQIAFAAEEARRTGKNIKLLCQLGNHEAG